MAYLYTIIFLIILSMVFWETRKKLLSIFFFIGLAMAFQVIGILLFQLIFPSPVNIMTLFIFNISIIGIWLGIKIYKTIFIKKLSGSLPIETIDDLTKDASLSYRWLFIFSLVLIAVLLYSFVDYYIPLFSANSQVAKIQFAVGRGIFMRLFKIFIPIISMFYVSYLIFNNPSKVKKILTVMVIITLLILSFLTAYKAWPAFTLVLMFLTYYYTKKNARVLYFGITILLSIASSMLITFFIYRQDLITTNIFLFGRLTQDQVLPVIKCIEIAQRDGLRWGSTFLTDFQYMLGTLRIMDRPATVFAVEIYNRLYGFNPNSFTAPTGFIGEVYVNFGVIGLFVFSILFGFIVYAIHRKACGKTRAYSKIFYIYLLFLFLYMTWGGTVIGTIEDLGISGLIFYLIWFLYNKTAWIIDEATCRAISKEQHEIQ